MKMRLPWQFVTVAFVVLAVPALTLAANDAKLPEPDIDIYALMSGKCRTLKIEGRDFPCKTLAYFHSEQGRANFTVALDDPTDPSHVISFSGDNGRKPQENLYELPIDRMLLNSKDRPKADGLPVPTIELGAGLCKQVGNFATRQVSTVACNATGKDGKKYDMVFESDGSPITVRRLRQVELPSEKRLARQAELRDCKQKAYLAKVLPRDRPAYIIGCLAQNSPVSDPDDAKPDDTK
jgi:hypothetical protein